MEYRIPVVVVVVERGWRVYPRDRSRGRLASGRALVLGKGMVDFQEPVLK